MAQINELSEYIKSSLNGDYDYISVLSENAINTLKLYKHKKLDKKLLLLKTVYRNDEIFRKLCSYDCKGYLPQIYLVSSEEDALYVVQEYIEGKSAGEADFADKSDEAVSCMIDVCRALRILHSLGIVHRDVKPENVIITPEGRAVLIDLSIAKTIGDRERPDTVNLGTIGYAAPEQFGFMQSRPETDIYAVGVMLNILLTGVHPMQDIPKGKLGRIIKKCRL